MLIAVGIGVMGTWGASDATLKGTGIGGAAPIGSFVEEAQYRRSDYYFGRLLSAPSLQEEQSYSRRRQCQYDILGRCRFRLKGVIENELPSGDYRTKRR